MASHQTVETSVEHKLPVKAVSTTEENNKARSDQVQRAQWVRAAILGASDGLLSTTSLMLGVGAAKDDRWSMIISGVAGAVAGACSMAVGEFVSVSTQRDIEKVSLSQSNDTLNTVLGEKEVNGKMVKFNVADSSLTISVELTPSRTSVPSEIPISEALEKITRKINSIEMAQIDEAEESLPSPHKAAAASALAFLFGSLVPLMSAMFVHQNLWRIVAVVVSTSIALAVFGGVGARLGGSPARASAVRVLVGGWLAMAITYGLLTPFDRDGSKDRD